MENTIAWRPNPPALAEVEKQSWWWACSESTTPLVLQLDVMDGVIVNASDDGHALIPGDWGDKWAPCLLPQDPEPTAVTDRTCNLCGLSCLLGEGDHITLGGLIDAKVLGGYESTPGNGYGTLDDTERYSFSLCEWCIDWLFSQFRVLAVDSYMDDLCPRDGETADEAFARNGGIVKLARETAAPPPWRPATERVAADEWRRMKDAFHAEKIRRDKARGAAGQGQVVALVHAVEAARKPLAEALRAWKGDESEALAWTDAQPELVALDSVLADARRGEKCICARCAKYDGCPNTAPTLSYPGYEGICADCYTNTRHRGYGG